MRTTASTSSTTSLNAKRASGHWRTGAIVGGVVGAALGGAYYLLPCDTDDCHRGVPYAILLSTFAFAVIGALVGSLF